jgi:hypothetical protein
MKVSHGYNKHVVKIDNFLSVGNYQIAVVYIVATFRHSLVNMSTRSD